MVQQLPSCGSQGTVLLVHIPTERQIVEVDDLRRGHPMVAVLVCGGPTHFGAARHLAVRFARNRRFSLRLPTPSAGSSELTTSARLGALTAARSRWAV